MKVFIATLFFALLAFSATAFAQDQVTYKYIDGHGNTVYADRPPLPHEKAHHIEQQQTGGNFIESDTLSYATQQAMENAPVVLYSYRCGDVCDKAESFLRARGIPYSYVDTSNTVGVKRLRALTGSDRVPVLTIGDQTVQGFNSGAWLADLQKAGYQPQTVE
jgi:glutaredoxin